MEDASISINGEGSGSSDFQYTSTTCDEKCGGKCKGGGGGGCWWGGGGEIGGGEGGLN